MNIYMVSLKATSGDKEGEVEIYYGVEGCAQSAIISAKKCAKRDGFDDPEISQVMLCGVRAF